MFNAIKYTKQLEEAGFSREQAEAQLQIISEILEGDLTTKQDLKTLEISMKQDLKTLEISMKQDLKAVETSLQMDMHALRQNMQQLEYRMTIKLGSLMIAGITIMATLMRFWLPH